MIFSFCPGWKKLIRFGCPRTLGTAFYNMIFLIFRHLKTIIFLFGTNEKLMVLGVPKLKHFRVRIIVQPIGSVLVEMLNTN